MTLPDGYDDWTVSTLEERLDEIDDLATLAAMYSHEEDTKNRITALEFIAGRLEEVAEQQVDLDEMAEEDPAEYLGLAAAEATADDADDEPEAEPDAEPDEGEFIRVRNAERRGRHVAGYSFAAGELKQVQASPQVRDALRRGDLQYVGQ